MNVRQARWLGTINEFDFEIQYIKGKDNRVTDARIKRVQVNHTITMGSYVTYLQDQILQAGQQDDMYRELRHRLQK